MQFRMQKRLKLEDFASKFFVVAAIVCEVHKFAHISSPVCSSLGEREEKRNWKFNKLPRMSHIQKGMQDRARLLARPTREISYKLFIMT